MKKINRKALLLLVITLTQLILTACNTANIKESGSSAEQHEIEGVLQNAGLDIKTVPEAIAKAEKAVRNGNMDLAQLYYIKAYDLEPKNIDVLRRMADLYSEIKKYELAEVCLKLILELQPDDLNTTEQYGLVLAKLKKYSEAEEYLGRVVAMKPSWPAYNGLGIIANLKSDYIKAENSFKKADSILPNSPEILNNLGFALYSAGKLTDAEHYYLKALQINPGYKKAIFNYGLLQARLSNYEQAHIAFAKVSSPAEANNNTGYIAMMNGDYAEANNYLQEAITASPRFYKKANENLERLEYMEKQ